MQEEMAAYRRLLVFLRRKYVGVVCVDEFFFPDVFSYPFFDERKEVVVAVSSWSIGWADPACFLAVGLAAGFHGMLKVLAFIINAMILICCIVTIGEWI